VRTPTHASRKRAPARPNGPNRKATVPAVGGLFFPQARSLGIDQTETSPALQQKIVYAGIVSRSFAAASTTLEHLADLPVDAKQVERLTEAVGNERVAQRDAATAAFQALPLVEKFVCPPNVPAPDLAVLMTDGGRLQILERGSAATAASPTAAGVAAATPAALEADWEEEPLPEKGHWREDKVGLLLTMQSEVAAVDPCPEIPDSFVDVLQIPKLARQLKKNVKAGEDAVADTDASD
jgi:hypothetical protein